MTTLATTVPRGTGILATLNGRRHKLALGLFMVVVIGHIAEHVAQAIQIWALGWKVPQSRGLLGLAFPWLVSSEAMHYAYAVIMLVGLFLLRSGFNGRALRWWSLALIIQFWHHIEHLLLIIQANTHHYLFGGSVPTSVLQVFVPRVELHLFYNTIVVIPMVVAFLLHRRPNSVERAQAKCACAVVPVPA
jgi:hypothetical protein